MPALSFHAVLLDETRSEFGVDISAPTKAEAIAQLQEDYPESRVVQIETRDEAEKREAKMYEHIARGGDWDEEGRPIFPGGYSHDDDDEK